MKKRTLTIALTCLALLTGVTIFLAAGGGRKLYPGKPFENLNASDIASATVQLTPPDKTIQIVETEELAALLRDVTIYEKDNSYRDYCGQAATFSLTMTDGSYTRIMEYNPFLVIDGVGYRTEYEPCGALLGAYSWQKNNGDGTVTATEADSAHPLDCKDLLPLLETTEGTATLRFSWEPDAVSVRCWSDEHWADASAESEDVEVSGNVMTLKPGAYIYEITARWNTNNEYGGTASYSAYLETIE